jgi:hypothetical protein
MAHQSVTDPWLVLFGVVTALWLIEGVRGLMARAEAREERAAASRNAGSSPAAPR